MASAALLDPVERFCKRLDKHVEAMDPDKRLAFLREQRAQWIEEYGQFCRDVDAGKSRKGDASDYVLGIQELGQRIAKLEGST